MTAVGLLYGLYCMVNLTFEIAETVVLWKGITYNEPEWRNEYGMLGQYFVVSFRRFYQRAQLVPRRMSLVYYHCGDSLGKAVF